MKHALTWRFWLLVALLIATLFVSPAAAIDDGVPVDGEITLNASNGPKVDYYIPDGTLDLTPFPNSNTVNITSTSGNATISSDGQTDVRITRFNISGVSSTATEIDAEKSNLSINPADKSQIIVSGPITYIKWPNTLDRAPVGALESTTYYWEQPYAVVDDGNGDFTYLASDPENTKDNVNISIKTNVKNKQVAAVSVGSGNTLGTAITDENGRANFIGLTQTFQDEKISAKIKTTDDPTLSSASPDDGTTVTTSPVELSINVSDPDFSDTEESVDVKFYNESGSLIGDDIVTSNGTATVSWDEIKTGANDWYAVATDSYGRTTTTDNFTVKTPDEIVIRSENTLEILDDIDDPIEVELYPSTDGSTVYTRSTENGRISMEDLPANANYAVLADVDGYEQRRIFIKSITEQSTIYLANASSSDLVLNEFTLNDESGRFESSNSRLYVQRALNTSDSADGTAEFQTIAGGYFGASERFSAILVRSERYRLIVENEAGQQRTLGAYTPETAGTVPLEIGEITYPKPETEEWAFESSIENGIIKLQYNDPTGESSRLDVKVYERGNESNVLYEESTSNPSQYQASIERPPGDSEWIIEYEVTRNDGIITNTVPVGNSAGIVLPVDQTWLGVFSMLIVIILMAAFPGPLSSVGGIVTVATAGMLILLGWLQIPVTSWFVAATISALGVVKDYQETTV